MAPICGAQGRHACPLYQKRGFGRAGSLGQGRPTGRQACLVGTRDSVGACMVAFAAPTLGEVRVAASELGLGDCEKTA
eukprot:2888683-Pyramimonas_sp.AAC.1